MRSAASFHPVSSTAARSRRSSSTRQRRRVCIRRREHEGLVPVGLEDVEVAGLGLRKSKPHLSLEVPVTLLREVEDHARLLIEGKAYIDLATREITGGDMENGRAIFQTVCAACHGFDGRRLDWGDNEGPAYVGTEAVAAPDEVLNKILNAHPGVEMVNLRAFGVDAAADVLRYTSTLPQE